MILWFLTYLESTSSGICIAKPFVLPKIIFSPGSYRDTYWIFLLTSLSCKPTSFLLDASNTLKTTFSLLNLNINSLIATLMTTLIVSKNGIPRSSSVSKSYGMSKIIKSARNIKSLTLTRTSSRIS